MAVSVGRVTTFHSVPDIAVRSSYFNLGNRQDLCRRSSDSGQIIHLGIGLKVVQNVEDPTMPHILSIIGRGAKAPTKINLEETIIVNWSIKGLRKKQPRANIRCILSFPGGQF